VKADSTGTEDSWASLEGRTGFGRGGIRLDRHENWTPWSNRWLDKMSPKIGRHVGGSSPLTEKAAMKEGERKRGRRGWMPKC